MMVAKLHPILKWWLTPNFPNAQIIRTLNYKPQGTSSIIRNLFRTWIVHPIKRRLARYYLIILRKIFNITVIGITGSAGKTSTKEMLASILTEAGETAYSYANIDPIFNIPSTILKCKRSTRYLVLEMGVEYPGEMDFYIWLAKPDIGIITNIYPTHTKFLGNSEGVFKEKIKLVLSSPKFVVLNQENKYLRKFKVSNRKNVLWFNEDSQVNVSNIKFTENWKTCFEMTLEQGDKKPLQITLPTFGTQFISNALAAAVTANALGISPELIKKGLDDYHPPEHRMEIKKLINGSILLDDSYNNNPNAAKIAINNLNYISRKKIIVFGDMAELGKTEIKYHLELGRFIAKAKPSYLICVGVASKWTASEAGKYLGQRRVALVKSWEEAERLLRPHLTKNAVVLVKGSRLIRLDKLVSRLS